MNLATALNWGMSHSGPADSDPADALTILAQEVYALQETVDIAARTIRNQAALIAEMRATLDGQVSS